MKKTDFFNELKNELHGHPFKDRYLEELEAHAEDLETEKLSEEKWENRMGRPKEIRDQFTQILNPLAYPLFILEALCYSFILLPLNVFFFYSVFDSVGIESKIPTLVNALIFGFTLFLFYLGCFQRYLNLEAYVNKSALHWTTLIILPSALWILISLIVLIYRLI